MLFLCRSHIQDGRHRATIVYHWTQWEFHSKTFFEKLLINWFFCIMWMFLGWFYTWSIILVQIGNPTWLPGPIMCSNWLKLWRSSCQKLLSPWNCYIIERMTGMSSAKFVIFLQIAYPRWLPQGILVYHWTLWEFHWKTFLWEKYSTNWIFCIIWMFLGWSCCTWI